MAMSGWARWWGACSADAPAAGIRVRQHAGVCLRSGRIAIVLRRYKRGSRLKQMEEQLPDALDFLARSMRAGHAFSISLEMIGAEMPDPLGQEFRALFAEHNLGAPLEVAMANFGKRVPLLDVRLFISSVALQRQTGGNLSEVLTRPRIPDSRALPAARPSESG